MIAPIRQPPSAPGRLLASIRDHRGFAAAFGVGAVLRGVTAFTYWPAATFDDSWAYLHMAYRRFPVGFAYDRPSGYPALIRLLTAPGWSIAAVPIAQHIAGLVTATLVYVLLIRLGIRKRIAVPAAVIVLVDGSLIAIGQFVATEAFFTLFVVLSLFLLVLHSDNVYALVTSGALVGAAVTLRSAGIVIVPIWIAYVLWTRRRVAPALVVALGVMFPLVVYHVVRATAREGVTATSGTGWFLYARIGSIASCRGMQVPAGTGPLCNDSKDHDLEPDFYMWSPQSPARRFFTPKGEEPTPDDDRTLRAFALATIAHRPRAYAGIVAADFLKYFSPGYRTSSLNATALPRSPPLLRDHEPIRRLYLPKYRLASRKPAAALYQYTRWVRVYGWMFAAFALAAVAAVAHAPSPRFASSDVRRRAIVVTFVTTVGLIGIGVAMVTYEARFMSPAIPLLLVSGAIGIDELTQSGRAHRWRTTTATDRR